MGQSKRANPCLDDTTHRVKRPVWYCHECGIGPFNAKLDVGCASCGNRRCGFSPCEWVKYVEKPAHDISPPQNQEPSRRAALCMTTSHADNNSSRAATPCDNTGREISNIGLTYPLPQSHIFGTGISTQPNVSLEATDIFASEQWPVGDYGGDLVQVPTQQAIQDPSSSATATTQEDTRLFLPDGCSQLVSNLNVGYYIHPAGDTTGSSTGPLQNIQAYQVDHGVVGNDTSVPSPEAQIMLPEGMVPDELSSLWPALSGDVSSQFPAGWDSQNLSIGLGLPCASDDDYSVLLQPQLSLTDYHSLGPPPLSTMSPDVLEPPKQGRIADDASKHYECCGSGEGRPLACLFYKYDPELHFNSCNQRKFKTIGHLRQHLDKHHKLGTNHCTACWAFFDTTDKLKAHTATAQCIPICGIPLDLLPNFPKVRWAADKKWYWGWRKLFGETATPPHCPFFHPLVDLEAQRRVENPNLSQTNCLGKDPRMENIIPGYADLLEEAPFCMSLDFNSTDDDAIPRGEDIARLLQGDLSTSGSCPSMSISFSPQSGEFD